MASLAVLAAAPGCSDPRPAQTGETPPEIPRRTVRDVRVLLATSRTDLRIRTRGPYAVATNDGTDIHRASDLPWSIIGGGSGITLGGRVWPHTWVKVVPEEGGVLEVSRRTDHGWAPARQYGGSLQLTATGDGVVQVLNVVDVETYVAGVLPGEIYPDFHREAFRAQAIASRTYVLYMMSVNAPRDYDLTAGEGSQVYVGMSDTAAYRDACAAVRQTRGLVCAWRSPTGERVFCTFFCAACGGMTCGPGGPRSERVPPLAGGVGCDYCRIARGEAYRWGPRSIPAAELVARVRARFPEASTLGVLREILPLDESADGRPRRFRLTGRSGTSLELAGEPFRVAVGPRVMLSTHCRVRVEGDSVVFDLGRGFGHGFGLCQWGMEGQARLGRTAAQILRFYYPGSHLSRAY